MLPILTAAILIACLCLTYAAPLAENTGTLPPRLKENYRLPTTIRPVNYNITLKPYLQEKQPRSFTFDGECYIEIVATAETSEIKMHMKSLNISLGEYYQKYNLENKIILPNEAPNNITDIVTYTLKSPLEPNISYVLHFIYTGLIGDDMHGFYRSSYKDSKNNTKWLGSTQFQTNHARRVFPSFDEPKFKATFDFSIKRYKGMKSFSNTRLIKIIPDGDYVTDVYATTPKMSTYILAFMVSEFNDRFDGDFGVLARPEYYAQTEYASDIGQALLVKLDEYFGIKYYDLGIDKMHLAAIPDFSAGAMENWGLLTFRERALLYEEGSTTLSSKQHITSVVAHEQAHMWFGDLVTCDWWSYTWLNEGFARYFEYFATDMVKADFNMEKQFVVGQIQTVMGIDSTNATNPMTDENTNTPNDLSRMFNSISYNKGATFIRMNKHIMGEDNFRKSLKEYLSTYKFTNTKPSNLFNVWKNYWPINFVRYADDFFATYTTQVGYPVVLFNRTSDSTVVIDQKRFLLEKNNVDPNLLYTVPITYTTSVENDFNNTRPKLFLQNNKRGTTITVPTAASWIIGNIQETGYYRVNYDNKSWHEIQHSLYKSNWGDIHEINRAQIVDDLLNLARAGVIEYDLAFYVLQYLETEINYLPWTAALNGFNYLSIRLGTDTADFGRYVHHLSRKVYNLLGFEEKTSDINLDIYNRAKIILWFCKYGNSYCINKAKSYFNKDLKYNPVPVNIRFAVYCTAMREGNENDFNKLYRKYKTETVATEQTLILNALGCVKGSELVSKYFHIIVSEEVRRQDKLSALSSLYTENNENVELVFDLLEDNLEILPKSMGDYSSIASIINNIAARFTTEAQQNKLKNFNIKHKAKFGSSKSALEKAEGTVKENLKWSQENLPKIKSLLQKHSKSSAAITSICLMPLVLLALIPIFLH